MTDTIILFTYSWNFQSSISRQYSCLHYSDAVGGMAGRACGL